MNIILSIGIAHGLFLVLLLLGKKENLQANKILAFLILLYTLFIGQVLGVRTELYRYAPHAFLIALGIPLLCGALHYLYVRTLISSQKKLKPEDLWHFALYFLNWIYFIPLVFKSKPALIDLFIGYATERPKNYLLFVLWAITIQGLIYMILSLNLIKKYKKNIRKEYSSIEKINLIWLNNITIITLSVWVIVFIKNIVSHFVSSDIFIQREVPVALGLMVLIYVMGYQGLIQTEIFTPSTANNNNDSNDNKTLKKYEKSGLSNEKAKAAQANLAKLMEEHKVYRENNLTLKELAKKLSISPHNLSEIINTHEKQNFFDFVNRYRIKDVKDAMLQPDKKNYTLLAIALDAGFNSKSSFNAIFKKYTNMTPSQYRKGLTS